MKKRFAVLLTLLLSAAGFAQRAGPFNLTANSQCATVIVNAQSSSTVGIVVTGTWSATLTPKVIIAGQAAVSSAVYPYGSTTSQATVTSNGVYNSPIAAADKFQVCTTSYSSGTVTIYLNVSTGSSKNGGGSGSGITITNVAGLASVPGKTDGTIAVVTDGNSATDCTTGGASTVVNCQYNGSTWAQAVAASSGATAFSALTSATNTTAAMVVGTGASLGVSGTGTIGATTAAKWASARTLAGNSVDGSANVAFSNAFLAEGTADAGLSGAFFLGSLATGILKNTTTTGVPSIAIAADFPTLNQNTTGSAAKWTTARNLAGNSVDGSANVAFANAFWVAGTADAGLSGANFMGSLGTGIVKNTTTTGVPSIAVAGDFPTLNQSTTGNAATATAFASYTGYSVYGSGASSGSWLTPTANAQCLMSGASSYATTTPSFQTCPSAGSGLSGMTALGFPIPNSATTINGSTTPGTNQGTYIPQRVNVTNGVAATITESQVGIGGRAITGSTSTDTVLYSDVNSVIDHDQGCSAANTETLDTPANLHNTSFGTLYWNQCNQTDTLKATTNTIQVNDSAPVAGSTGISIGPGQVAAIKQDPNLSTNWLVHVADSAGLFNGSATIPLNKLATQAANTQVANVTGSTAAPTATAIPSGIQNYVAGTGYNQATSHQEGAAIVCADTSGSGTAQVCNTSPSFTPAANDFIIYTTTTANTGTGLTVNVNSLGAKSVAKWQTTTTLAANDVRANTEIWMKYDGTNWEMDSIGNAPSGSISAATYYETKGYNGAGTAVGTANHTICNSLVVPPGGLSVGHMGFQVTAGDGGGANLSDLGFYNSSGTLVAHIGAQILNTIGRVYVAFSGGTQTIAAGVTLVCYTSTSTTLNLEAAQQSTLLYYQQDAAFTTSGGALNGSVTFPTLNGTTMGISNDGLSFVLAP